MISYNILTTNFPFIEDPLRSKKRPALAITKAVGPHQLVVVAFITTNLNRTEPTDILLEKKESYFSHTGLSHSSIIQLHKLFTLPVNQLQDNIGMLSPLKSKEVQKKLKTLFKI